MSYQSAKSIQIPEDIPEDVPNDSRNFKFIIIYFISKFLVACGFIIMAIIAYRNVFHNFTSSLDDRWTLQSGTLLEFNTTITTCNNIVFTKEPCYPKLAPCQTHSINNSTCCCGKHVCIFYTLSCTLVNVSYAVNHLTGHFMFDQVCYDDECLNKYWAFFNQTSFPVCARADYSETVVDQKCPDNNIIPNFIFSTIIILPTFSLGVKWLISIVLVYWENTKYNTKYNNNICVEYIMVILIAISFISFMTTIVFCAGKVI